MNEKTRKIGLVQDLVQEFKKCISKKSRGRVKIWNFERKNSMANITRKPNGTYLIRISCGTDASGKQITKSKIFKPSKLKLSYQRLNKEIDDFVRSFEEEIETYGIQERPDKIRFAEFCEKYLNIKKTSLSPITYAFYEKIIREELIPMFGTIRMKEFRTYHVQQFIQYLSSEKPRGDDKEGHIAPSTVKRYTTVLRSILTLAYKLEYMDEDVGISRRIEFPKHEAPEVEVYTLEEVIEN